MQKIYPTIIVTWEYVYSEVRKVTGFTGYKSSEDGSAYKQLGVKESQYELLDRFWLEAIGNLTSQFRRYLKTHTVVDAGVKFELEMPGNWNMALKPSLEDDVKSYIVNYIVSKWLRISDNSEGVENKPEPKYMADAEAILYRIGTTINTRKRPTPPSYSTDGFYCSTCNSQEE